MALNRICLKTELCIVGGGIAGLCAAITASRLGAKVVCVRLTVYSNWGDTEKTNLFTFELF